MDMMTAAQTAIKLSAKEQQGTISPAEVTQLAEARSFMLNTVSVSALIKVYDPCKLL